MRGAIIWDVGSLADLEQIILAGPAFLKFRQIDWIMWRFGEIEKVMQRRRFQIGQQLRQ